MNNERAATMLATLQPGTRVSVRAAGGMIAYGRAERARGQWRVRYGARLGPEITSANLIGVFAP